MIDPRAKRTNTLARAADSMAELGDDLVNKRAVVNKSEQFATDEIRTIFWSLAIPSPETGEYDENCFRPRCDKNYMFQVGTMTEDLSDISGRTGEYSTW